MSKILSTVYVLLALLMCLQSPMVASQEEGERVVYRDRTTEGERDRRALQNACNAAKREWSGKFGELSAACASTSVNLSPSGDSGDPTWSCANTLRCCLESDQELCENNASPLLQNNIDRNNSLIEQLQEQMSEIDASNPQFNQMQDYEGQVRSLQNRAELYGRCPMRGAVGIDQAYEDAEEAREKLEEKEEGISDLQQQINEAQAKLEEDKLKIENDMKKLETDTKADLKEIRDQQEDAIQRLMEAIEGRQQKIRELQRLIMEQEQSKAGAYEGLQQKITELQVGCYEQALGKAQRTRARVVEKAAGNQYSAGSLETLFKSVGSSTLEDTQKLVEYHRRLCENDFKFKESMKIAQRAYNSSVQSADRSINIINEEISLERVAISRLQSDEKLKIHQDAMERIALLEQAYKDGLDSLQKQYQNTVMAASRQIAQLQQQLAQKQTHLQAARDHLSYKNSILELQKQATGGDMSLSEETWSKAVAAYYALRGIAVEINDTCNCESGMVQTARDFLAAIGRSAESCNNANRPGAASEGVE